jgi:hypothetical protein
MMGAHGNVGCRGVTQKHTGALRGCANFFGRAQELAVFVCKSLGDCRRGSRRGIRGIAERHREVVCAAHTQ